jgi:cysteinyl-tRNA synthetase
VSDEEPDPNCACRRGRSRRRQVDHVRTVRLGIPCPYAEGFPNEHLPTTGDAWIAERSSRSPLDRGSTLTVVATGAPLRLYNSLGRQLGEFAVPAGQRVGMYSCGPTVYADPHLGNMRPYVFSDTLRRVLAWKGYDVVQVVNITDVGHAVGDSDEGEDKVEVGARREGRTVREVTEHYTQVFFDRMRALNVLPAHHSPRATAYVPQMIEFARELEGKGFTYLLPSGLYFDTARLPSYGALALMPEAGQLEGARVAAVVGKRSPADFAVWRTDPPDSPRIMRWDSPWGPGVPGWHLECSVMSIDLLGPHFDIHTGGVDHRQIHHINEIAQSEAYLGNGRPWVPLWMHNEFLVQNGQKIAKSAGRMPTLAELPLHPLAFRYFLLTAHYRRQLDLTDTGLSSAASAYRRLLARVALLRPQPVVSSFAAARAVVSDAGLESLEALDEALSDDLNTPRALALLHGILRSETLPDADKRVLVAAADHLLGLSLDGLDASAVEAAGTGVNELPVAKVETLVAARTAARAAKDFAEADRRRARLADLGVAVTDTPDGPVWRPA